MQRLVLLLAVLISCGSLQGWVTFAWAGSAEKRVSAGFYEPDSVRDIFSSMMHLNSAPEYEYFPPPPPPIEKPKKLQEKAAALVKAKSGDAAEESKNADSKNSEEKKEKEPALSEEEAKADPVKAELFEKYGDPAKKAPITAVENAPTPFKGLIASLEAGRDDLAFQYAKQYARHLRNLNQSTEKVLSLTGTAMQAEGMLGGDEWINSPQFEHDKHWLDEEIAKADSERNEQGLSVKQRAQDMVRAAQRDEEEPQNQAALTAQPPQVADERTERSQTRARLAGRVPIDPGGQVDVYFFLNIRDAQSYQMSAEIEKVFEMSKKNKAVNIVGMTARPFTAEEESEFRRATGATFPILNGSKLAESMQIRVFPATVFVAANTSRAYVETRLRKFAHMDELIKIMRGI